MTSKYKKVKFKNENEIFQTLTKAPKSFSRQVALYSFYLARYLPREATKELYNVEFLTKKQLMPDPETYNLFSQHSLPYVLNKIPFNEFDIILKEPNKYPLSARLAYERDYKSHFRFLKSLKGFSVQTQNWHHEGNPVKAFFILGKYDDTIYFSNRTPNSEKYLYICEAFKRMGLFTEAIKHSEYLTSQHYKSKKILREMKKVELFTLAGQYNTALNFIKSSNVNGLDSKYLRSFLYCKYYSLLKKPREWQKHFREIKKHYGRATHIELTTQKNNMMILLGKNSPEIYTQLNKDEIIKNPNILDYLYSQADLCLAQNKLKDTIKWIVTAKKISPLDIRDSYEQAKYFLKAGETAKAEIRIKQFLNDSPKDIKGLILNGMIQLEQEKFEEAEKSFSKILNKDIASYYLLVSKICKLGPKPVLASLNEKPINSKDFRLIALQHLCKSNSDKEDANKELKKSKAQMVSLEAEYYAKYKLGEITLNEFKKRLDFGPVLSLGFNFTIGFEAMQKGNKEEALKHFKKCLIPYSIDLPEYHMAKACIKMLEK